MSASVNQLRNASLIKTEVDVNKLGPSGAEVCFLGRSNVGKSSLINALCVKKNMAHVSQVPGKTRTINVYQTQPGRWLVDLPGYGFAVGGSKAKDELGSIIENYLKDRLNLKMIYVVIDAVAGPTKLDIMMIEWLKHYRYQFTVVVNKVDKIAVPKFEQRKAEILKDLDTEGCPIFWVSTSKKIGINELQHSVAGYF